MMAFVGSVPQNVGTPPEIRPHFFLTYDGRDSRWNQWEPLFTATTRTSQLSAAFNIVALSAGL